MSFQRLIIISIAFLWVSGIGAQQSQLAQFIQKRIPGATVQILKTADHFKEVFEIRFQQPLDHNNPRAGSFEHRIFLSHVDPKRTMLFVTEGYAARQRTYELAKILQSNQLIVEYRFYGASRPEQIQWQYLTNDQATEDLHRIKKIFKKFYRKKWVSTGISKGGTTTLVYKSKYPRDVCVSVPYVAPLAFAQEDKRTDKHQMTIGPEACRKDVFRFQRLILERRNEMIPLIETYGETNNHTFSLGAPVVLEYAALEFPFSFWQWGGDCNNIPGPDATAQTIFDFVENIVSWSFYSDQTSDYFLPSFYQFMTELGYYGFPTENVKDLLKEVKNPSNLIFAPQDTDLTYKPYLQPVNTFLKKKGNRIIYIYGEYDTWTACAVDPSPKTKHLKMVLKEGSHTTRIRNFSKADQQKIYDKLEQWLRMEVKEL